MVASIEYISSPKVSHTWHIRLQSEYNKARVMLDLQWLANIEHWWPLAMMDSGIIRSMVRRTGAI